MVSQPQPRSSDPPDLAEQVEAVLVASRVLVAISAQSIAALETQVTVPQLRAMVVIASLRRTNLAALAEAMGVHASNATRACDRLVELGLLDRRDNPTDRRNVTLELTGKGRRLVAAVMARRRRAIRQVLRAMSAEGRSRLVPVLTEFASAAGELPATDLWSMGWTTATSSRARRGHLKES